MDKKARKSAVYEVTPFRLVSPLVPRFSSDLIEQSLKDWKQPRLRSNFPVVGGDADVSPIEDIQSDTKTILEFYEKRFRRGDRKAVQELLDVNPEFIKVPWVAEAYLKFKASGLSLRKTGRPKGTHEINPLILVGLVDYLLKTETVKNKEKALCNLEDLKLGPS
jgi:hypothetical protein